MLSTWNKTLLLILASVSLALEAQEVRSHEGSWQHADGLWLGLQRTGLQPFKPSVYLVDDGSLEFSRSAQEKSEVTRLEWTLGVGEQFDRFAQLDGQTQWAKTLGRHRLSLGLNAGGSLFVGSTRFANLEDQFLLTNALSLTDTGNTHRWGLDLSLSDTIALTRTLDLSLESNHQEAQSTIAGLDQSRSEINSWGANLEQRWVVARLQGSARKTEMDIDSDPSGQNISAQQSVLDLQARMLAPLLGRLNGSIGWQDLRSTAGNAPERQLSGPELGLSYTPQSSWSAAVFARALREKGSDDTEGQLFGEASLAFRTDAKNNFVISLNKQIDLLTSFRVFTTQNVVTTDQQRSTVTGQVQWAHQRGRYQLTSSIVHSYQDFDQSEGQYTELNLAQTYDITRRGQLNLQVTGRQSRFDTDIPPVSIDRQFINARAGWQETLPGGLRPLGGRIFYRVDAAYEHLHEDVLVLQADRFTLLFSFGQLGNF